jgi:hypothetical protein
VSLCTEIMASATLVGTAPICAEAIDHARSSQFRDQQ